MKYFFLRFPEGKFKALTLSYDDGVRADERFSKTLNKYGIKCTFNINSAFVGQRDNLTFDELQTLLLDCGHEVAVHGERHMAPGIVPPVRGMADVINCRLTLERELGRIVRGMAYPDSGVTRMFNGNSYNAKSLLNIIAACIKCGSEIELVCDGPDENEALADAVERIESGLGE